MSEEETETRPRPLSDVRIIALEQYGAGPFGSMHLADLGAEVIKIEDPSVGGDVGRYVPPFQQDDASLFFETFNRNKRSLELDLRNAAGRRVFEDLVRSADVVYSNLRGDVPAKLHIRYNDLRHLNPKIVCCSLSGFGMTGPRSSQPGYDYILQALAGWMAVTGEPGGPPEKTGLSLVDYSGGYVAITALLAALHAARRDGVGTDCDVSLYDTAVSLLNYLATWNLTEGYEPARTVHSAHPSLVPFQNFETADGWIVVGCAKEKFWHRLVDAIDLPELRADPRFDTFSARNENRSSLLSMIGARLMERSVDTWLEVLGSAGVPCARINTVGEALVDSQVTARDLIVETDHPIFGRIRQVASPVRVGPPGSDHGSYRRAPLRNEDADYVLSEVLAYDQDRVTRFAQAGAFGVHGDGSSEVTSADSRR
jgi:crotonobetainyl-CoA:carnitine CoA-transferase CaiB-like acyl-CoA transferase